MDCVAKTEKAAATKLFSVLLSLCSALYIVFFLFRPLSVSVFHETSATPAADFFYVSATIVLLLQMILYVACFGLLERVEWDSSRMLRTALLLAFALSLFWPTSSNDHFQYLSHGRLFLLGANPYLIPYSSLPDNPLYGALSTCWAPFPSPYGPLVVYLSAAAVGVGGASVTAILLASKLLYFLLYAATLVILAKDSSTRGTLFLFAFNPLVLFELMINAHNDLLIVFFLAAAFHYLKERPTMREALLCFVLCWLSVFVKFTSIMITGFIWLFLAARLKTGQRLLFAAVTATISVLLFFLLYGPFWTGGQTLTFPFINFSSVAISHKIFPSLAMALLVPMISHQDEATFRVLQKGTAAILAASLFVCFAIFAARIRTVTREGILLFLSVAYLLFFLFSPHYVPWYVCVGVFVWTAAYDQNPLRRMPVRLIFLFSTLGIIEYLLLR